MQENRIILTRDVGILKNKVVTHGYWVRETDPLKQIREVLRRFDLYTICRPFSRCLECDGMLYSVNKDKIKDQLPEKTDQYYKDFMQCDQCKRIYWQGAHYDKLKKLVDKILL